jgi:hypothetical protein
MLYCYEKYIFFLNILKLTEHLSGKPQSYQRANQKSEGLHIWRIQRPTISTQIMQMLSCYCMFLLQ